MGAGGGGGFEETQEGVLQRIIEATNFEHVEFVYQFARSDRLERGTIRNQQLEVLWTSPPIDITDPDHLTRFIDWASETFPSRYTALFAKDHGDGHFDLQALPQQALPRLTGSGIFQDGESSRFMPIPMFRRAIERSRAGRFDVLGLDGCLLGSVEVAYELRKVASFLISSEQIVRTTGWAYAEMLAYLDEKRDLATPRSLAEQVVERSSEFKLTAVSLTWIPALAGALDVLGKEFLSRPAAVCAWAAATFGLAFTDGIEIGRLVDKVVEANNGGLRLCEAATLDAVSKALADARLVGNGIGVYFPMARGSLSIANYGAAAFARDTCWAELVGTLNCEFLLRLLRMAMDRNDGVSFEAIGDQHQSPMSIFWDANRPG